MRTRNLLGAAAFSVALAGGGVAGAMLGTPGVSGAQDGTTSTTEQTTTDAAARPRHPGARLEMKAAADALGMTPAELLTELRAGKSIAQVAEDKGVDLDTVTDAMVAEGTARLEEAIAKLPDRVAEAVQREGMPEHRRGGHGPRPADAPADADDAPADASS